MLTIMCILRAPEHSRNAQQRYATACSVLLGMPSRRWSESDGSLMLVFGDTLYVRISAVCGMRIDRLEIDAQYYTEIGSLRDHHVVETRWASTRRLAATLKEWGWAFYFERQIAGLSGSGASQ